MIIRPELDIWSHTKNSLYPLYADRAAGRAPEMGSCAQAARLYAPHFSPGDRILDAGAGSGYFHLSLKKRGLLGEYHALDSNADFIDMGRRVLAADLPPERFHHQAIENASGRCQAVFCLNTLFALPDYRQPLEALLEITEKIFILRAALGERTQIRYETDAYLDPGAEGLKSYFNIWPLNEVREFIASYGFTVTSPVDERTGDAPEISAGKVFPWRWLVGRRRG